MGSSDGRNCWVEINAGCDGSSSGSRNRRSRNSSRKRRSSSTARWTGRRNFLAHRALASILGALVQGWERGGGRLGGGGCRGSHDGGDRSSASSGGERRRRRDGRLRSPAKKLSRGSGRGSGRRGDRSGHIRNGERGIGRRRSEHRRSERSLLRRARMARMRGRRRRCGTSSSLVAPVHLHPCIFCRQPFASALFRAGREGARGSGRRWTSVDGKRRRERSERGRSGRRDRGGRGGKRRRSRCWSSHRGCGAGCCAGG